MTRKAQMKQTEKALENAQEYKPERKEGDFIVIPIMDLLKGGNKKADIITHNLIQEESVSIIGGCSGVGKSWIALQIGMCVASGKPVFDYFETDKARKVLLCNYELTDFQIEERLRQMQTAFAEDHLHLSNNFRYARFSKKDSFVDRWHKLDEYLERQNGFYDGGVIVVDNLYSSLDASRNTSDNQEIIPILKLIGELNEKYNVAIVLITHHIKGRKDNLISMDDIMGGANLTRYASNILQIKNSKLDTDLRVAMITKVRGERSDLIEMPFKMKHDPETGKLIKGEIISNESLHYVNVKESWEIKLVREMKSYELLRNTDEWTRADIYDYLSSEQQWERTKSNETKVTRFVNKLVAWGLVEKLHHGIYKIVATEVGDD